MKSRLMVLATAFAAIPVLAQAWTLETDTSTVSFGSIKNDYIGEAHSFSSISGSVGDDGAVLIEIALASVSTNIDIRNERMIENVFGDAATATISANVDIAALEALPVGDSTVFELDATLSLLGVETPFFLNMFVLRLSENRVLASSDAPVYLSTEDLEINDGITVLQELAGLDSITRVTPLSARFIFAR